MIRYIDDETVLGLLPPADAESGVDSAFRALADGTAVNAVRQRSSAGDATVNVMWAMAPAQGVLGVKEYVVVGDGSGRGTTLTLVLNDITTGALLAVLRADALGRLRTAAASVVATRALGRRDASVLAVFGTGFQAEGQLEALAHALPDLARIDVVGRDPARRDAFVARMRERVPAEIAVTDARTAAARADVIVTATGAAEPVLLGEWVRPGTHVVAVGSNNPAHREVDRMLLERCTIITVDDREVAAAECGDLIANSWDPDGVATLGEVLTGRAPGRRDARDITLFESQGLALQDVICAATVYRRAVAADAIS